MSDSLRKDSVILPWYGAHSIIDDADDASANDAIANFCIVAC